jgi:hypothetical protein
VLGVELTPVFLAPFNICSSSKPGMRAQLQW